MKDIVELAEKASNKEDFVSFLQALVDDLRTDKQSWENDELERYLEAMGRFLKDPSDKSITQIDFKPSWALFARIMIAASIYELLLFYPIAKVY